MITRQRFFLMASALIAAALALAYVSRTQAQGPTLRGQLAPSAAGDAITYQGRLLWNGAAVDGQPCSIVFSLWDAETGGRQIGSAVHAVVFPKQGYFTVSLDFGEAAFDGGERWLQMQPSCEAAAGPVLPRVALAAAPMAHTLRPGAVIRDASGNSVAVYAQSGPDWTLPLFVALKLGGLWGDSRFNDGVIGTSQQGNGVYGYSETGKAVYADGDAHVEGDLTWKAKTSVVSVAPAAFEPNYSNQSYTNFGYTLKNTDLGDGWWSASVQLPHGATLTAFTACWRDGVDGEAYMALKQRPLGDSNLDDSVAVLASVTSRGSANTIIKGCSSTDVTASIDNDNYAYLIDMRLPPDDSASGHPMEFYGARIEYVVSQPY